VLARLAHEVRQAQHARGGRPSLRYFATPFLVIALKHADALGDALTARGVR
jgi:biotin transport system permease protein